MAGVPQNIAGLKVLKGTAYGPAKYLSKRRRRYRMMNQEEMDKYNDKVTQTMGFDVDGCTGCLSGRIIPIRCPSKGWELATIVAEYAVKKHYEDGGKRLNFVSLDKANLQPVAGTMYYLTFTANDTTDGCTKIYRSKVWHKAGRQGLQLMSFEEYKPLTLPLTANKGSSKAKKGKTVQASAGGALIVFTALVKKIKSENPSMTHAKARKAASEKWKLLPDSEKQSLISEQV